MSHKSSNRGLHINDNPILKTINYGTGLMEFLRSTSGNVHVEDQNFKHCINANNTVNVMAIQSGNWTVDLTLDGDEGLSTSLNQTYTNSNLSTIVTHTADNASETTLSGLNDKVVNCNTDAVVVSSGAITETNSGSIKANTAFGLVVGGGLESTALRVTMANDSTGVMTVDSTALDIRALTNADVVTTELTVIPLVGSQANVSNAQTTIGEDEQGTTNIDCQYVRSISAYGSTSGASTISLLGSMDNVNFYDTGYTYEAAGEEEFYIHVPNANARYYGVTYSASGETYTCTISGK